MCVWRAVWGLLPLAIEPFSRGNKRGEEGRRKLSVSASVFGDKRPLPFHLFSREYVGRAFSVGSISRVVLCASLIATAVHDVPAMYCDDQGRRARGGGRGLLVAEGSVFRFRFFLFPAVFFFLHGLNF